MSLIPIPRINFGDNPKRSLIQLIKRILLHIIVKLLIQIKRTISHYLLLPPILHTFLLIPNNAIHFFPAFPRRLRLHEQQLQYKIQCNLQIMVY